ncbi:30033_t:CDS:2 [Gigaspora margarita]|uniref:30033_t:CDS:1 n=1 Tax=Gigaspora margarita TaxID=4874 RepID=A0ABN7UKJ0_GIGMA|nr:30033_t:CDS:2 [Gigaspora margarita]
MRPYFITINAKGSKFYIHKDYIKKYPETYLYGLMNFNDLKHDNVDERDYEIDVDYKPYIFDHIYLRWEGRSSYLYRKSKLNCKSIYDQCFCGKQKFIDDKFCYSCIESERKLLEYCNNRKRFERV